MTQNLITRLSKLDAPDREVDGEIWRYLMSDEPRAVLYGPIPKLTASVDAAIALAERVLPGWGFFLRSDKDGHNCGMVYPVHNFVTPGTASGATAAISMCIAILSAKEASKP
ncbi:hypothetical protein F9K94_15540 [Brucella tritici]|uniref:Phage ABA sandwich domain-containing protein n=1 Tax=Brucella tritici TaxID=94626 RepID=A0A7V7VS21_9HYPH|nr:hypothetical protein [Brucella tritici]KAB2655938.1 hypothetical protein F9K94_15540 [Brucella tritici]